MEEEILKVIEPGAIQAAVSAAKTLAERGGERVRAAELELEQSRYEPEHCFRQYDASDPENRLVAGELERRWNEALGRVGQLEQQLVELQETQTRSAHVDAGQLLDLAGDLPRVWHDPQTEMRLKKRIVRIPILPPWAHQCGATSGRIVLLPGEPPARLGEGLRLDWTAEPVVELEVDLVVVPLLVGVVDVWPLAATRPSVVRGRHQRVEHAGPRPDPSSRAARSCRGRGRPVSGS